MVDVPESPDAAEPRTADDASSKAAQKVELDLDDAPFLQGESSKPPQEAKAPPAASKNAQELPPLGPPKPLSFKDRLLANKKRLLLAGGALVVLIGGGISAAFFLFRTPVPPALPEPETIRVVVPGSPPPLPAAPVAPYQLTWDSFWVEQRDPEGVIRFLICAFTIPTDSAQLYTEMQAKKVILRDAVFYYLRNRPFMLFSDPEKVTALKRDLMTVINEHVASGKVEEIFIENYLVK